MLGLYSQPSIYNVLQEIGDVHYLTPTETSAKYDIIVLPPDMGINPNLECFKHANAIPIAPIDPVIEVFRDRCLEYYLDLDTIIIGIGDNAALIWNELGNNVAVTSRGLQLIDNKNLHHSNILGVRDYFIEGFRVNNLIGMKEPSNLGSILLKIRKEILDMMEDDISNAASIQQIPKTPAPVNKTGSNDIEEAC